MPKNHLLDQYKRRYRYLRLSITDACNFQCQYCLPNGYEKTTKDKPLNLQEIQILVDTFAQLGTEKIRITGGEPTIRKDLVDIIALCNETKGIQHIGMTSNGYQLAPKLNSLISAGLSSLNISADSLDPKTFALITGRDKLDEIYRCIETALSLGLKTVKMNVVLMREYHQNDIAPFIKLLEKYPITIRFIELMQTGDNKSFYQQQHLSGLPILNQLESNGWQQIIRPAHAGPAIELSHKDFMGNVGFIMPYSKNFCSDCNRLRVSAQGNLHTCLFHKADAELRTLLTHENKAVLLNFIQEKVQHKWQGHQLDVGDTGSTIHLAMIGG